MKERVQSVVQTRLKTKVLTCTEWYYATTSHAYATHKRKRKASSSYPALFHISAHLTNHCVKLVCAICLDLEMYTNLFTGPIVGKV